MISAETFLHVKENKNLQGLNSSFKLQLSPDGRAWCISATFASCNDLLFGVSCFGRCLGGCFYCCLGCRFGFEMSMSCLVARRLEPSSQIKQLEIQDFNLLSSARGLVLWATDITINDQKRIQKCVSILYTNSSPNRTDIHSYTILTNIACPPILIYPEL